LSSKEKINFKRVIKKIKLEEPKIIFSWSQQHQNLKKSFISL
jgi:hypothetical protein